jgi:hypothetical protein
MISRLRPVARTVSRKAWSSNAFHRRPADRVDAVELGQDRRERGTVDAYPTPIVDKTIGMPNALAVLASSRTFSSTMSAFVSERMTSNKSSW